jgi:hypothetical protein
MQPSNEALERHLEETDRIIQTEHVPCILCGKRGTEPMVWVVPDELGPELYIPHNRFKSVGYALCSRCERHLTDEQLEEVEDTLIDFLCEESFSPRGKTPAVFLN